MDVKWQVKEIDKLDLSLHSNPIISRLLGLRGFTDFQKAKNFFNFDYSNGLHDPFMMKGMKEAVRRISQAIKEKQKIVIYGDYDADGVTAMAVLKECLKMLGAETIDYIPDKQLEGYGLNEEAIRYLAKSKPQLMITVDCGITNIAEVETAKSLGMDVIITDHHYVPSKVPQALAIVNPNQPDCGYPFKNLSGVGVSFKLAQALVMNLDPAKPEQLKWLLDLVAIGTIADSVIMLDENRILAKYGLLVLSKTRRPGLKNLYQVGRINIDENNLPDSHMVQFQIAPRINAAGRMDHASMALNLITSENEAEARRLALEIEDKNQDRMKVTDRVLGEVKILAANSFRNKKFIFAAAKHWPLGILGLVAGKIADEFNKPAAIFQEKDGVCSGSLRSIEQLNIIESLHECRPGLMEKFGGHSQAAGVTVKKENFEALYNELDKIIEKKLGDLDISPVLWLDAELKSDMISWELITELGKFEPFGEGNEEPLFFSRSLLIKDLRTVGNGNKHLKMGLAFSDNSPKIYDAIFFSFKNGLNLKLGDKIDIAYHLRKDEWGNNQKIQMILKGIKVA